MISGAWSLNSMVGDGCQISHDSLNPSCKLKRASWGGATKDLIMARIMDFSKRLLRPVTVSWRSRRQLRLRDSANLTQALTIATENRHTFQKFSREAQTVAVRATFARMAEAMERGAAEIRRIMTQTGDDDPPHCA
jgi:hypothetical protein